MYVCFGCCYARGKDQDRSGREGPAFHDVMWRLILRFTAAFCVKDQVASGRLGPAFMATVDVAFLCPLCEGMSARAGGPAF